MANTVTVRYSESRGAWVVKEGRRITREFDTKGAALDFSRDLVIDSSNLTKRVAYTKSGEKQQSKTLVREDSGTSMDTGTEQSNDGFEIDFGL